MATLERDTLYGARVVSMYWSEVAELTHAKQVTEFGWCMCEEQEVFPYNDCPKEDD